MCEYVVTLRTLTSRSDCSVFVSRKKKKYGRYLLNWKENRGRHHLTSIKWGVSTHAGSSSSGRISVCHPSPPGGGNVPTLVGNHWKKNNSLNNTNSVTRVSCLLQLCIYNLQNQITLLIWIFRNSWLKKKREQRREVGGHLFCFQLVTTTSRYLFIAVIFHVCCLSCRLPTTLAYFIRTNHLIPDQWQKACASTYELIIAVWCDALTLLLADTTMSHYKQRCPSRKLRRRALRALSQSGSVYHVRHAARLETCDSKGRRRHVHHFLSHQDFAPNTFRPSFISASPLLPTACLKI